MSQSCHIHVTIKNTWIMTWLWHAIMLIFLQNVDMLCVNISWKFELDWIIPSLFFLMASFFYQAQSFRTMYALFREKYNTFSRNNYNFSRKEQSKEHISRKNYPFTRKTITKFTKKLFATMGPVNTWMGLKMMQFKKKLWRKYTIKLKFSAHVHG